MPTLIYNDMTFTVAPRGDRWIIGINGAAAHLVHPGDLVILIAYGGLDEREIVGPDVTHPNFIYWNKDSVSCPRQL